MYVLIAEDLTHLGGPMGSEYTTKSIVGHYSTIKLAKAKALKIYQGNRRQETISWEKRGTGFCSGDLAFVMYHIEKVKIDK